MIQSQILQTSGHCIPADFGFPDSPGTHPGLLLAPGIGYHKDSPLIKLLFEKAVRRGVAAARFDWSFFHEGREPSPGFEEEKEELRAVLEAFRADPRVEPKLFLGGKSLGSVLVHQWADDPAVRATFLMTPVVRTVEELDLHYPGLKRTRKPVVILAGDRDPHCPLPTLYEALSGANERVKLLVVGGDHSLKVGNGIQNRQNLEAACRLVLYWLHMVS